MTSIKWILKTKKYLSQLIMAVLVLLFSLQANAQCPIETLANDLKQTNGDLKSFLDESEVNSSIWQLFFDAKVDVSIRRNTTTLADFAADFANNADAIASFKAKSDLVDAWKLADLKGVADVLRKNPEFLKHFDELTDNTTLKKHVFDGEINKKNSVKGGHFDESFDGNNFRLGDGTTDLSKLPQNSNGVRKIDESIGVQKKKILKDAQGNVTGERWLDKNIDPSGGHTLFPEGWSKDKIIEEASSAFANPTKSNWNGKSNAFKATSNSGVEVGWFVDPSGNITTFFPIF